MVPYISNQINCLVGWLPSFRKDTVDILMDRMSLFCPTNKSYASVFKSDLE